MKNNANNNSPENRMIDTDFELQMRDLARSYESTLAPEIAVRLKAARRRALLQEQSQIGYRQLMPKLHLPSAVTALASVVLLVTVLLPGSGSDNGLKVADDAYLLSANPDFYEDLEFYEWLAEHDTGAGGNG